MAEAKERGETTSAWLHCAHQPASQRAHVTCVLLTYFRIPWHAGRASAYCGRYFAFTRLFILIKAPLALSSILPSARVLRSRFVCLTNDLY